jgi:hypothetical protein
MAFPCPKMAFHHDTPTNPIEAVPIPDLNSGLNNGKHFLNPKKKLDKKPIPNFNDAYHWPNITDKKQTDDKPTSPPENSEQPKQTSPPENSEQLKLDKPIKSSPKYPILNNTPRSLTKISEQSKLSSLPENSEQNTKIIQPIGFFTNPKLRLNNPPNTPTVVKSTQPNEQPNTPTVTKSTQPNEQPKQPAKPAQPSNLTKPTSPNTKKEISIGDIHAKTHGNDGWTVVGKQQDMDIIKLETKHIHSADDKKKLPHYYTSGQINTHKLKMERIEYLMAESLKNKIDLAEFKSSAESIYSDGKDAIIKLLIKHWYHEALIVFLDNTDKSIKKYKENSGYNGYKWLNQVLFPDEKMYRERNISDAIKTIDILLANGNNICSKNIKDETSIDALNEALNRGIFTPDEHMEILERFYKLKFSNVIPDAPMSDDTNELYHYIMCINNRITQATINFAPNINYIVHYEASVLVDVLVNELLMTKKTVRTAKKLYFYENVINKFNLIISFLGKDPKENNNTNYNQYFDKNKWFGDELKERFCKSIIKRCMVYDIKEYTEERNNFEAIGAFIGLAGKFLQDPEMVFKFIEKCFEEEVEISLQVILITMVHLGKLCNTVVQKIFDSYDTLIPKDKFMFLDIIAIINKIEIKITLDEAKTLCNYEEKSIERDIQEKSIERDIQEKSIERDIQEKSIDIDTTINYEEKAYDIINMLNLLQEHDEIIINEEKCSPDCIDDVYFSLNTIKQLNGYCEENIVSNILLIGVETFTQDYHIIKMNIFCKNMFDNYETIYKKYTDQILEKVSIDNPIMSEIVKEHLLKIK